MAKKKSEQFEDALKSLEKIVEKLERGEMSLEDALTAFTDGIQLVKFCHSKLDEAENRIQALLKDQQGEWCPVPFESAGANSAES